MSRGLSVLTGSGEARRARLRETLETERLRLEPVVESHAAVLIRDLRDPLLYRCMKGVEPPRLRALEAQYRSLATGRVGDAGERCLLFAAWIREERRYAGVFEAILGSDERAHLGYLVFTRASRRGYALEACQRLLQHLFHDHGALAAVVDTGADNVAGRTLAERLGFREALAEQAGMPDLVRYVLEATAPCEL
jgi:RimJ/RimL family protein N-acetyltransferase